MSIFDILTPGAVAQEPHDKWRWATVTMVSPLTLRFDGDTTELHATSTLVAPNEIVIGSRVWCQLFGQRVIVLGVGGGTDGGAGGAAGSGPPIGVPLPLLTDIVPAGYIELTGAVLSRTTYAELFAAYGTKYGAGDGSTTFGTPNLKGRSIIGIDSADGTMDTTGDTGGAKTVTLTAAEMPSHTHTQNSHAHTQAGHKHDVSGEPSQLFLTSTGNIAVNGTKRAFPATGTSAYFVYAPDAGTVIEEHTMATVTPVINAATAVNQNTGGDGAHPNMPPFMVARWITRYSDLVLLDWVDLVLSPGVTPFSPGTSPKYSVRNGIVTIAGIIKPASAAAANSLETDIGVVIAELPAPIVPVGNPYVLVSSQESANNRRWFTSLGAPNFLMGSRYGPGAANTSTWLPFSLTYQI